MSERKSVTRETLAAATMEVEEYDERAGVIGRGRKVDRIFDALPATPPVSETVDAAREAILTTTDGYVQVRDLLDAFEAAIRAEADAFEEYANAAIADRDRVDRAEADERVAALDVERLARALYETRAKPDGQTLMVFRGIAERAVAEYARLSDADPEDAR